MSEPMYLITAADIVSEFPESEYPQELCFMVARSRLPPMKIGDVFVFLNDNIGHSREYKVTKAFDFNGRYIGIKADRQDSTHV